MLQFTHKRLFCKRTLSMTVHDEKYGILAFDFLLHPGSQAAVK